MPSAHLRSSVLVQVPFNVSGFFDKLNNNPADASFMRTQCKLSDDLHEINEPYAAPSSQYQQCGVPVDTSVQARSLQQQPMLSQSGRTTPQPRATSQAPAPVESMDTFQSSDAATIVSVTPLTTSVNAVENSGGVNIEEGNYVGAVNTASENVNGQN